MILLAVATTSMGAQAGVRASWQGTVLCTAKTRAGYRSLAVDGDARLAELRLRAAVSPGWRVELAGASVSKDGRTLSGRTGGALRVLAPAGRPVVVQSEVIENGYGRYGFYRDGRPWGCPVAFQEAAAVSVAKLVLSSRSGRLTLALRDGHLVHLAPREQPLAQPGRAAKAEGDVKDFIALLARGNSIAACARLARDALRIHGGPDGCLIAFESAKFLYRERYARASVARVALFDLRRDSYALATITRARRFGPVRAFFIREGGMYRYLGDFELSPFELW